MWRMWNEMVMTWVRYYHIFLEWLRKKWKYLSQDSHYPWLDLSQAPPKYNTANLLSITQYFHLICIIQLWGRVSKQSTNGYKTCDTQTWIKHLFLDTSSTNIDTLVPSLYNRIEIRSIKSFDCCLSQFHTSVSSSVTFQRLRKNFSTQLWTALRDKHFPS
jgi:hypothetical protein